MVIYHILLHDTLLLLVHWDLAERVPLVCVLVSGNQVRLHAARQPAPKSQSSAGSLYIGQGFEASHSFAIGQSIFLHGSSGILQLPQVTVAPDTDNDYARLFAAHASTAQT